MKKVITGNQAAAWGAYLAKSQVVAAYPITPQTSIVETLASLMLKAVWKYKFINVESEHSAMAACIAASLTGVRVFTATSSQGLLLMHELLHWAGGGRLPIVLTNVNRAVAPGWNIWTDQQDSLSQRDTGWAQIYASTSQEVLDCVIIGFRMAEKLSIPVMVVLDAFSLSHTAEAVEIPSLEEVEKFLPTRVPGFKVQPGGREAFGEFVGGEPYQKMRQNLALAFDEALPCWERLSKEWSKCFGRIWPAVDTYRMEKADIALVVCATASGTARIVIDDLRSKGIKAGLVNIRLYRPFPREILRQTLAGVKKVAVLDRNCSWGSGGIFFEELGSTFYGLKESLRPKLHGFIYGLGGVDITASVIEKIFRLAIKQDKPPLESVWLDEGVGRSCPGRDREKPSFPTESGGLPAPIKSGRGLAKGGRLSGRPQAKTRPCETLFRGPSQATRRTIKKLSKERKT